MASLQADFGYKSFVAPDTSIGGMRSTSPNTVWNPTTAATTKSSGTGTGTGGSRYASLAQTEMARGSAFNFTETKTGGAQTISSVPTTTTITKGTPQTQAALESLIAQLQSGGSPEYKAQLAKKAQAEDFVKQLIGAYTSGKAFDEAKGLMALNLQQAMEKNMPVIQRAMEGAGTSASSMQAILSQNLSRDAALAASSLGAQHAQVYAGTTANLANSMLNSTAQVYDKNTQSLVQALQLAQAGRETQTKEGGATTTSTAPTTITRTPNQSSKDLLLGSGINSAGADEVTTLDPMRYYSQYGKSGSNQSLYDFLKGM